MTTREAFKKLLSERGSAARLGRTRGEFGGYRSRAREGKYPSEDLMTALLIKAGYKVVQERKWGIHN